MAWRKKNATKSLLLSLLPHELLAIPETLAPLERIWSKASQILSLRRASLKPEVAKQVMFVKETLSILQKHYQFLTMKEKGDDQLFMVLQTNDLGQSDE